MIQLQVQRLVALAIVVPIGAAVVAGDIEAVALIEAGAYMDTGLLGTGCQAQAALEGVVAAGGQADFRIYSGFAATGEDLDDATNGICTVKRGARATDHFDTLDVVDSQVVEAGETAGGRGNALAVDQHQCLRGAGAAQRQRRHTARAAHLYAWHTPQQLGHAAGL